jgi:sugar lactone lactonase YvrE
MIIADWGNHRIVQWKLGDMNGQVIAGGNGQGDRLNQLNCPTDLLIDKETNSLIICDQGNRRIVRWSRHDGTTEGEILLENIACWGLAMDDQRCLYISDIEKDEVRRYQMGEKNGTVVAGGHGRGVGFNQFNRPTYIFVDQQQNVYVSDTWNYRVMKWNKDATDGTIVVRGSPRGLFVDTSETVYVSDYGSHRLMCWPKGAAQGTVIAGGNPGGDEANQLYFPWGLSSDQHGNLYVADHSSHRVQRFPIKQTN